MLLWPKNFFPASTEATRLLLIWRKSGWKNPSGDWTKYLLVKSRQFPQRQLSDKSAQRLIEEFHPEAVAELLEAAKHYDSAAQGLGEEFVAAVEAQLQKLCNTPALGQSIGNKGLRRSHLRRFPYSLIYYANEARILILAVAHQSRRPGYWKYRA